MALGPADVPGDALVGAGEVRADPQPKGAAHAGPGPEHDAVRLDAEDVVDLRQHDRREVREGDVAGPDHLGTRLGREVRPVHVEPVGGTPNRVLLGVARGAAQRPRELVDDAEEPGGGPWIDGRRDVLARMRNSR